MELYKSIFLFILAGLAEIGGGYLVCLGSAKAEVSGFD
jgi:drug/metabolite transporter superfamily protein YnfA